MTEPKRPKDMTPGELKALPIIPWVSCTSYVIGIDAVPKALERLAVGLPFGHTIRVPRMERVRCFMVNPDDLLCWTDEDGSWTPAQAADGSWGKRRF